MNQFEKKIGRVYVIMLLVNWLYFVIAQDIFTIKIYRFSEVANLFAAFIILLFYVLIFILSKVFITLCKFFLKDKIASAVLPFLMPGVVMSLFLVIVMLLDYQMFLEIRFDAFVPIISSSVLVAVVNFFYDLMATQTTSDSLKKDSGKIEM